MLHDWSIPAALAPPRDVDASSTDLRRARFDGAELESVARWISERGPGALAGLSVARRLAAWIETIEALLDPESDERRALLPALVASSGLSPAGLTEALEVVLGGTRAPHAEALLARLPAASRRASAGVVLAANVPGLAVQSVLPALLLGRPLLIRSSRREPLFAPALVGALARREPTLADAFAALTLAGDDEALESALFGRCERLLAYGGEPAVAALARRFGDRLTAFGPRASVALVAGRHDPVGAGRALARDVALLDQRGCLSVQALFVAGDARETAETLAFGLEAEQLRLPPGPISPAQAAAVQQLRGEAEMRDALIGVMPLLAGTVVLASDDGFRPSPGLRTVRVHPVASLDAALEALHPWRGRLQGAALAGEEALERAEEIAARLDLARVAPAGRLQHADAGWASGGIDPLLALG